MAYQQLGPLPAPQPRVELQVGVFLASSQGKKVPLSLYFTLRVVIISRRAPLCPLNQNQKRVSRLWPGGSVGWSIVPYTKGLQVRCPVRAHS